MHHQYIFFRSYTLIIFLMKHSPQDKVLLSGAFRSDSLEAKTEMTWIADTGRFFSGVFGLLSTVQCFYVNCLGIRFCVRQA